MILPTGGNLFCSVFLSSMRSAVRAFFEKRSNDESIVGFFSLLLLFRPCSKFPYIAEQLRPTTSQGDEILSNPPPPLPSSSTGVVPIPVKPNTICTLRLPGSAQFLHRQSAVLNLRTRVAVPYRYDRVSGWTIPAEPQM